MLHVPAKGLPLFLIHHTTPHHHPQVYYAFAMFCASLALSAAAAIDTSDYIGCAHVKVAQTLVLVGLIVLNAVLHPFCRMRDMVADFLINGTQALACALMAVGYYNETSTGTIFDVAGVIFIACAVLILTKVVCDVCCELHILFTRSRALLQEEVFAREAKGDKLDGSDDPELLELPLLPVRDSPAGDSASNNSTRHERDLASSYMGLDASMVSAELATSTTGAGGGRGNFLPAGRFTAAQLCGSDTPSSPVTPLRPFPSRRMGRNNTFNRFKNASQSASPDSTKVDEEVTYV